MHWKLILLVAPRLLAAASLLPTLSACAASGSLPSARELPPLPGYVQPVAAPEPSSGDDAVAVAARERAARVRANQVISAVSAWYADLREQYRAGGTP